MKRTGIINRDLSAVVAAMGHYDRLVVSDAGFPVPPGVPCIDLSLGPTRPTVLEVLDVIQQELEVEQIVIAEESLERIPDRPEQLAGAFPAAELHKVPHSEFKEMAAGARAVVRTGDFTSYANVLLISGVVY